MYPWIASPSRLAGTTLRSRSQLSSTPRRSQLRSHEDAKRVPCRVCKDVHRLLLIVGSVEEQTRSEGKSAAMLNAQVLQGWNRGLEGKNMVSGSLRPRRLGQIRHLLERQAG